MCKCAEQLVVERGKRERERVRETDRESEKERECGISLFGIVKKRG